MKNKIHIEICTPARNCNTVYTACLVKLLYCLSRMGISNALNMVKGANIYRLRDQLLVKRDIKNNRLFEGKEFSHVLWIDSDQVFNGDDFEKLYKLDKDIAGAAIRKLSGEFAFGSYKNGILELVTEEQLKDMKEPLKVDFVGHGFLLVKADVYRSMTYPWYYPDCNQELLRETMIDYIKGLKGKTITSEEIGFFENKMNSIDIKNYRSEDDSFCKRALKAGFEIWVDPLCRVLHEKDMSI